MYYTYNSLWWFFWVAPLAMLAIGMLMWSGRRGPDSARVLTAEDSTWLNRRTKQARSLRGKGPRNYRRSDMRILEDVSDRLMFADDLDASEIEVHVQDGIVQLDGNVASRYEKRLAEALADDIAGVMDVHNRLVIGPAVARPTAQPEATSQTLQGQHP